MPARGSGRSAEPPVSGSKRRQAGDIISGRFGRVSGTIRRLFRPAAAACSFFCLCTKTCCPTGCRTPYDASRNCKPWTKNLNPRFPAVSAAPAVRLPWPLRSSLSLPWIIFRAFQKLRATARSLLRLRKTPEVRANLHGCSPLPAHASMTLVAVTGGGGYVATELIHQLLVRRRPPPLLPPGATDTLL